LAPTGLLNFETHTRNLTPFSGRRTVNTLGLHLGPLEYVKPRRF
jgi:hypothetical protein